MRWTMLLVLLTIAHSAHAAVDYSYRVIEKLPHDRGDFVQGLEIRNGYLYQGTGRYGHSTLKVFRFPEGNLVKELALPERYFGEGITVLDELLVQLTWRSRKALVYRRSDLGPLREFALQGEGWGLTNNGRELIMSDGSAELAFLSPEDGRVLRKVTVRYQGVPVRYLNELEWGPDYLLANVWGSNWIMMINPDSGQVVGRINLRGLLPVAERSRDTDVLNGIAIDPDSGDLWVTGKNWPWLYRIELIRESALE
jgi:glutamine cyclotransferase